MYCSNCLQLPEALHNEQSCLERLGHPRTTLFVGSVPMINSSMISILVALLPRHADELIWTSFLWMRFKDPSSEESDEQALTVTLAEDDLDRVQFTVMLVEHIPLRATSQCTFRQSPSSRPTKLGQTGQSPSHTLLQQTPAYRVRFHNDHKEPTCE